MALQPSYNLINCGFYERELADLVAREGMSTLPYYGLARGFLTGKYPPGDPEVSSPRSAATTTHMDDKGLAVLAALDKVAAAGTSTMAGKVVLITDVARGIGAGSARRLASLGAKVGPGGAAGFDSAERRAFRAGRGRS